MTSGGLVIRIWCRLFNLKAEFKLPRPSLPRSPLHIQVRTCVHSWSHMQSRGDLRLERIVF